MKAHLLRICVVLAMTLSLVSTVQWELAAYRVRRYYELTNSKEPLTIELLQTILDTDSETILQELDSVRTAQGTVVKRLIEQYNGSLVKDSQIDVNLRPDGSIDRVGGRLTQGLGRAAKELRDSCKLSKEELKAIVMDHEGTSSNMVKFRRTKVERSLQIKKDGTLSRLAAVEVLVTFNNSIAAVRTIYTVDLCTGAVIKADNYTTTAMPDKYHARRSRAKNQKKPRSSDPIPCDQRVLGKGGNKKTKVFKYGYEPYCLNTTTDVNGNCLLENNYIRVVDLKHGVNEDHDQVVSFSCLEGYNDEFNGAKSAAMDTFFHASQVGEMFRDWYAFSPLTDPVPKAYVHFGHGVDNALWDGLNLLVGDGGNKTFPYSALDTIAHELAHGVTERRSNLEFKGQSGGISESFSDMTGEAAEVYVHGSNDWLVGAHILKSPKGVVRYFEDPTLDRHSIGHMKDFKPGMDVHFSSGLLNRAFFLISQTVGIRRAYESFLVANRIYWRETTTFAEAACDVIKGAYDSGLDMNVYKEVFLQVGIELKACSNLSDFVLPITGNETRNYLRLSKNVEPTFKITAGDDISGFSASISGAKNTRLNVMSSYSRLSMDVLKSRSRPIDFNISPNTTVYLRLTSKSPEEQTASLTVSIY